MILSLLLCSSRPCNLVFWWVSTADYVWQIFLAHSTYTNNIQTSLQTFNFEKPALSLGWSLEIALQHLLVSAV